MTDVRRLFARFGALSPRTRIGALAALVVTVALVAAAFELTRDARVPLFATPLKADQLAEVETHLAAWRIAYAPLPDNVRVDPRARADVLLRLALAGVPRRHLTTSDEAFAHVGALTPQSVLDAQSRDALAADLAQGLRGLDGVADAQVIVAPASGGVYADEPARDASASVRITLVPGARLTDATVAAIRSFVAGGVPGLDAARVVVLDDRGALGDRDGDDDALRASLQSALDLAFGSGATIVRVHREPVGERREDHDVTHLPLAGTLTRSAGDERYTAEKKTYVKENVTEERGNETRDVVRVADADATARLSVAVFVDGARLIDLDKIRALAAAATGIDPRRGDTLEVEAVRFTANAALSRAPDGWALAGAVSGVLPQLALVAALVTLVVAGSRPLLSLASKAVDAVGMRDAARAAIGLPPARVRGALAGEPPHVAAAVISALPASTAAAVLELYPADERAQIVRRLARANAGLVPSAEELLRARG